MTQNHMKTIRNYIQTFRFEDLFIDGLGWDHARETLVYRAADIDISLRSLAQKRGMHVFFVASIPEGKVRRAIEQYVAKTYRENIIIYSDQTQQIWQWVRREVGKPLANRERTFSKGQSGEHIAQILSGITFGLDEEETLTIIDVTSRVRAAFDVERVTKRFYDRFKKQHDAFLAFIEGIPDAGLQQWYASVMLNRLMFIYFVQRKGFLDGDSHYLRNRLARTDGNFYRDFLCPLFFEGFATKQHSPAIRRLLGDVPYLNGGLFMPHQIEEQYGAAIEIANDAFERLFDFFDEYHWHLDDRTLKNDNEINPDVLGYIFEKYINQKQMGAYYTKEDITEYISKNTVIPFLFDEAHKAVKIAFEGKHSIWDLLVDNPDRYIYPALRHGVELPLPENIAVGLDNVAQRGVWNTATPSEYGLPTEIWRETVARRLRYQELRHTLTSGEVRQINDLITYNLDIQQFAQDVIGFSDSSDMIRAFWKALNRVTVLDPTCGSGAFLFAALNILEPLYEACLERMTSFVAERERSNAHPHRYSDFSEVMERIDQHPNRRYFILKSIIVQNLYGVDIMEEAVEIAKLRLFLKLVAQISDKNSIEPLPDIDFNIRAGNTLVGFATQDEVRQAMTSDNKGQGKFLFGEYEEDLKIIEQKATSIDHLSKRFRQQQTALGGEVNSKDKTELKTQLRDLGEELNQLLARQYGIDTNKSEQYKQWRESHQPFHWFVEFYGVLQTGGFDVIVGNPPYLELRQISYKLKNYKTESPVHSVCIERSLHLLTENGSISMIVPLAIVSTQRMQVVQQLLEGRRSVWYSNFAWRPSKLFDQVNRALTIFVATSTSSKELKTYSTNYQKWISETRNMVIPLMRYIESPRNRSSFFVPKFGDDIEAGILKKLMDADAIIEKSLAPHNRNPVYYRTTGGLYWKVFTDFPPSFVVNGKAGHSTRETRLNLQSQDVIHTIIASLSSNIFWWWYTITSNLRDLNPSDIYSFPISKAALFDEELRHLGKRYIADLKNNSTMLVRLQKQTGRTETQSFKVRLSKNIIDDIDRILAKYYGFDEQELDFIINYDIKYRMGDDISGDEE